MIWEYIGETSRMSNGMFRLMDGDKALFRSYAAAKAADKRSIDTRKAELIGKKECDGGLELVFRADNGLVLTEKLFFYQGKACAQCALSDADGKDVETNYLQPLAANAGGGEAGIPLWWHNLTRQLYVPFDNDNWLRYEITPLHMGRTSYDFSMLLNESTREGLFFGAIDFDTWKNGIVNNYAENKTLNCVSGVADIGTHDALPHGTLIGKSVESSRFVVLYGPDYRSLLEQYGDIIVSVREPIRWKLGNPFGFNAFAGLARKMSNEIFERTGDFMYNEMMPRGFQNYGTSYMNLDGGWQRLDDDERMRSKKIRDARGQMNGVYDGPFGTHAWGPDGFNAELPGLPGHTYAEILLRDEDGNPLPPVDGQCPYDVTHPVWHEFTKAKFDQWKEMDYDYCKLDFLTHGCMEGVHYDKSVRTGRQAITKAYEYICELIDEKNYGKPMFVSISIAPIFPYGFAHARRSCCDTFGTNDHIEYVLNGFTYSWWENRRLYDCNDADHLVLYQSFCMDRPSTEGEAKARFTTGVISGGVMLLSDDFDNPNAQERAKKYAGNQEVNELARSRVAFRPVEFNGGSASHAFTAEINGSQYLAVFCWQSCSEQIDVCLDRAGIGKGIFRDLWTGKKFDGSDGRINWTTDGCDALLLKLEA